MAIHGNPGAHATPTVTPPPTTTTASEALNEASSLAESVKAAAAAYDDDDSAPASATVIPLQLSFELSSAVAAAALTHRRPNSIGLVAKWTFLLMPH